MTAAVSTTTYWRIFAFVIFLLVELISLVAAPAQPPILGAAVRTTTSVIKLFNGKNLMALTIG